MMPMMAELGLSGELEKALTVVAIGAGSAVFLHANDSFFWVVTQMSGMDVGTGYKLHGMSTAILGLTAACISFIAHLVLV